MILTTSDEIPGKRIIKTLGLVRGNTIRARHVGRNVVAALRGIVGGEITEYTKMITKAQKQTLDHMTTEAEKENTNAVATVRFGTSAVMKAAAEILAYGTAVVIE